jgi:hypothetical protein
VDVARFLFLRRVDRRLDARRKSRNVRAVVRMSRAVMACTAGVVVVSDDIFCRRSGFEVVGFLQRCWRGECFCGLLWRCYCWFMVFQTV